MMPWQIPFDEKMRLEGPYRYVHAFVCVLGAMSAGRVFFPDGLPISVRAAPAATKNSSRSDLMNIAVGFNPRWEFRRVA